MALTNKWAAFRWAGTPPWLSSGGQSTPSWSSMADTSFLWLSVSSSCLAISGVSPQHKSSSYQRGVQRGGMEKTDVKKKRKKQRQIFASNRLWFWKTVCVNKHWGHVTVSLTTHCRYDRAVPSLRVSWSPLNKARRTDWASSASGERSISCDPAETRRDCITFKLKLQAEFGWYKSQSPTVEWWVH